MISLEDFHADFLQQILSDTEIRGLMKPEAFFEKVCEVLVSSGDLTNDYTAAEYTKIGVEVHGYDFDEERKILSLIVHQFFQEDEIKTLTKTLIEAKFNRLKGFFKLAAQGIYSELEETSPEYSMAYNIYQICEKHQIENVRLIVLTDGRMTKNLTNLPSEKIAGFQADFRVVDIEYIYKIYLSAFVSQDFDIEVKLPCLEAAAESEEYKSYLAVVPGSLLVDIYQRYGQKLFEQNVRTFLQFKTGVNKGLRNTIEYHPDMFFAYNNGITATASELEFDKNKNITKIVNFQIVNGGQTTSAIYAASKNMKLDVSKVSVQMKLSVVKEQDKQNDFVSKVSEYANTQNKINKSDFFSNSPFHKQMKDYSKRLWAAAVQGAQRRTRWFYERARGEYLNEQVYLTQAQKKQFLLENPKQQYLDKTFLSKSEMSWLRKPEVVSRGAQYSFSYFADEIAERLEKDELAISEKYFKHAVARVILFREVEKMISKADWYDGGYRAQTVTYSIAYLSHYISKMGRFLNFDLIWETQELPAELIKVLKQITEYVYEEITSPPAGIANISQWAKKEACWESVKKLDLELVISPKILINKEEAVYQKVEEKKNKQLESSIEMQMFVVSKDMETWNQIFKHYQKYGIGSAVSVKQMDILHKMSLGRLPMPSPDQSKILYHLYQKAASEGVAIEDI
jgi:hypothetical protein